MVRDTPFDTIAAISTPPGEGGIGIVKLSGDMALSIVENIFHPHTEKRSLSQGRSFTMHLGLIRDQDRVVDEVLVSIMRAPHTYTREDVVEINCHGGAVAVNEVLRLVLAYGARLAEPGEFTKRAFIKGRIDLSQAEAVLDIVQAKTGKALQVAVRQLQGALSSRIEQLIQRLKEILAVVEANIDFPEEEDVSQADMNGMNEKIVDIQRTLESLIKSYDMGKAFKNGVLTVLSGKPNVGKSSLFNAFVEFDRAIVTHIPGTTRDVIEEQLNVKGIPFVLADTAGITETENLIEKEGVRKSRSYIECARLILAIFDGSCPLDERDLAVAREALKASHIGVINKTDLPIRLNTDALIVETGIDPDLVHVSAKTGEGLDRLKERLYTMVTGGSTGGDYSLMVTNTRHHAILQKAHTELTHARNSIQEEGGPELVAFDIRSAMDLLGEITGKVTNRDILDEIFNNFCIGK